MTGTTITTGDPCTDALVPTALELARAVHHYRSNQVAELLRDVDLTGLAVVLAAMVPHDLGADELLAWQTDPAEYDRLAGEGVSTLAINVLLIERRKRECAV